MGQPGAFLNNGWKSVASYSANLRLVKRGFARIVLLVLSYGFADGYEAGLCPNVMGKARLTSGAQRLLVQRQLKVGIMKQRVELCATIGPHCYEDP
jgi:hypothetical protein